MSGQLQWVNKKPVDSAVWEWRAQTDKLCLAQTRKTKFHVSVIMWLILLAASLVLPTCSWESIGFDILYNRSQLLSCGSLQECWWWQVSIHCSRVPLCPGQELLYHSWYICRGPLSINFTCSEWECIPAGRSNHSEGTFWQLCTWIVPRLVRGMEEQCHSGDTCPQAWPMDWPRDLTSAAFFFPNRYRRASKMQQWSSWLGNKEGTLL